MDTVIPITRLEEAINYWRNRFPATGDECILCPQASALAAPYALMILDGRRDIPVAELDALAREAFEAWAAAMANAGLTGR